MQIAGAGAQRTRKLVGEGIDFFASANRRCACIHPLALSFQRNIFRGANSYLTAKAVLAVPKTVDDWAQTMRLGSRSRT